MIDPSADAVAGCYVHLPFCDRICPYCDFAVLRYSRPKARRYIAAVLREIERAELPAHPVATIFLGGGTPSALDAEDIAAVLEALFQKFGIARGSIECTLEANPSRHKSDLAKWRRAGVTRLSVGVQSLDDDELHRLGRDHSARQAIDFIAAARAAGFENISTDVIAGAPGQTLRTFAKTLDGVCALRPEHVSVYGLTIEAGTPYARWFERDRSAFPDDDAVADLILAARERLASTGFVNYEISNFAMPGHECRHNIGYWRQRECLAFGMSAAGYADGERYRNVRAFDSYCEAIEQGRPARDEVECLSFAARVGEAAMLALRTSQGICDDDFRRRFGIEPAAAFAQAREKCTTAGLLEADALGMRLTHRGKLLANDVCAEFLHPQC